MNGLRARLAEVRAMLEEPRSDHWKDLDAMWALICDAALDRALADAERVPALESALSAAEAERDALRTDALRWRYLQPRICWSSDGLKRTYYYRVDGRTDFTAAIDDGLNHL